MDNKAREEIVEQVVETIDSLNCATDKAGGGGFTLNRMRNMTLFEFICNVASSNGIRFVFVPPEGDEEDAGD